METNISVIIKLDETRRLGIDEIRWQLEANLRLSLGAGFQLASVGLYGGVVVKFEVKFTFGHETGTDGSVTNTVTTAISSGFSGYFGAYVKALYFRKNIQLYPKTKADQSQYLMRSRLFLEDEYVYDGAADAGTEIVCLNGTYYRIYITDVSDLEG